MGIQGLLPMLKEAQVNGHISDFKGKRLAVDAYVWLHKGAFGCAEELVKGQKTTKFVDYAMHRVRMLRHFGITPYIVFDGGPLPAKKGTEAARAKSRAENLTKVRSYEGQRGALARDAYTKCVDITPEMAYQFIKALRAEGVDYVVAPYEADAQLCFLEREGYVDGIITEDSDLLVFGCRQVIFKLDHNGQCVSINRDRLNTLSEFPMNGWGDLEFRRMAMLSGCDYLPSIPGIGIKTAHKLLRRYKSLEKLLQSLRLEGGHDIPLSYDKDFAQAELAFLFQRVYDPLLKRLVPLNNFTDEGLSEEDQKWVGLDVDSDVARGMALGDIHPETLKPIEDQWPDYKPLARTPSRTKSAAVLAQPKVTAGPMDAFIKRTLSDPLPKPIGVRASGICKLSDQHLFSTRRVLEHVPSANIPAKRSKFFGGKKSAVKELEEAIQAAKEEIVWEKSDAPEVESQEPETLPLPRKRLGSSSPGLESEAASPSLFPKWEVVAETDDADNAPAMQVTSPAMSNVSSPVASPSRTRRPSTPRDVEANRRSMSRCSSPICSSPVHIDDVFSPPRPSQRGRRAVSPGSPSRTTRADVLVDETQDKDTVEETQMEMETPRQGLSRLTSFASFGSAGSIKSIKSILVPQSSPSGTPTSHRATAGSSSRPISRQAVHSMSSDSIEEDELVTPSVPPVRKTGARGKVSPMSNHTPAGRKPLSQPTSSLGKRKSSQASSDPIEIDEEELEENRKREEKAKIVAAGWKRKFSLDVAFPKPRSTRVNKETSGAMTKWADEGHDPVFSPPPKVKRPVLVQRSSNVGVVAAADFTRKVGKAAVQTVKVDDEVQGKKRKVDVREDEVEARTPRTKAAEEVVTPVPKVGRFGPGLKCSSLEKFRFTGKVNMEYQD